jgi:hypothetical protein
VTVAQTFAMVVAGLAILAIIAVRRRPLEQRKFAAVVVIISAALLSLPLTIIAYAFVDPRCSEFDIRNVELPGSPAVRISRERCTQSDRVPQLVWIKTSGAWFWRLAAEFDPPFEVLDVQQLGGILSIRYRTPTGIERVETVVMNGGVPQRIGGHWTEPRIFGRRL